MGWGWHYGLGILWHGGVLFGGGHIEGMLYSTVSGG